MNHESSWLVDRDPYFMAFEIIPEYNWVVFDPLYNPTNRGEMNTAQVKVKNI